MMYCSVESVNAAVVCFLNYILSAVSLTWAQCLLPCCCQPCASFNSSGDEGPGSADKKQRFEAMRKQHYNMKQALQQVRDQQQSSSAGRS
jgi:hypothetical protein